MPSFSKIIPDTTEEECKTLIQSLKNLKEKVPEVLADKTINDLEERIVYINTKQKTIENSKFWNIVKNDIEYFREKERLRIMKGRGIAA